MADGMVPTNPVRVRIFLRTGAQIQGLAHIKAGGYQRRISDVLNLGQVKYIAVTEVVFSVEGQSPVRTKCMLVNVEDISLVDATPAGPDDEGKSEPELPAMNTEEFFPGSSS